MITYQVDMDDLLKIESVLKMTKDKSKMVLRGALNETAKDVRNLLADEAAKVYVMKRNKFFKHMVIDKAKVSNLVATVHSSGRVNELYDFKVSPYRFQPRNKPPHHKGKVVKQNAMKELILKPGTAGDQYKAFVVRYRSGHITIGQRVPGKRMKSKPEKEFVKTLLSPSIPGMLGDEKRVYGIVAPKIEDILAEHVRTQIEKFLG